MNYLFWGMNEEEEAAPLVESMSYVIRREVYNALCDQIYMKPVPYEFDSNRSTWSVWFSGHRLASFGEGAAGAAAAHLFTERLQRDFSKACGHERN